MRPQSALGLAWAEPAGPAPWTLLAGATGCGLLAAAASGGRAGLAVSLAVLVGAVAVAVSGWSRYDPGRRVLGLLAVALGLVATVRDSPWLVPLCLLGMLGLVALVTVDGRRWVALFTAPAVLAAAIGRSVPWLGDRVGKLPTKGVGPWLTGAGIGLGVAGVIAALLASADQAFAEVFRVLVPQWDLGALPGRLVVAVIAAGVVIGSGYASASTVGWGRPRVAGRRRPAVEWLMPLICVDVVLLTFLAVQATLLFGGADVVLQRAEVTYAERARTGFGQLVTVTLITLLLLGWAGIWSRRGAEAERSRALLIAGGTLVGLSLAMVVSALRRLWLYDQAYGWTVTRITSGAFELWLAFVLVAVAALWWLGRTGWSARVVAGSAGVLLLALGLSGPDALAASWNVSRYQATGKLDPYYLQQLSDDAVPALSRLPEPLRSCLLAARYPSSGGDGWAGWNLARHRAAGVRPAPAGAIVGRSFSCSVPEPEPVSR